MYGYKIQSKFLWSVFTDYLCRFPTATCRTRVYRIQQYDGNFVFLFLGVSEANFEIEQNLKVWSL